MVALELIKLGTGLGVILPEEALAKLGWKEGDSLYLAESPGPALQISMHEPEVAEEIALGETFMDENAEAFRALAK